MSDAVQLPSSNRIVPFAVLEQSRIAAMPQSANVRPGMRSDSEPEDKEETANSDSSSDESSDDSRAKKKRKKRCILHSDNRLRLHSLA